MASSGIEERAARARAGSRRQRDLEALREVGGTPRPDTPGARANASIRQGREAHARRLDWIERNLPEQDPAAAEHAVLYLAIRKRKASREDVEVLMRERGTWRESGEAA